MGYEERRCWANCSRNKFPRFSVYVVMIHQRHREMDRQVDGQTDDMRSQDRAMHRAVKTSRNLSQIDRCYKLIVKTLQLLTGLSATHMKFCLEALHLVSRSKACSRQSNQICQCHMCSQDPAATGPLALANWPSSKTSHPLWRKAAVSVDRGGSGFLAQIPPAALSPPCGSASAPSPTPTPIM